MFHPRWLLLLMLSSASGTIAAPVGMPCQIVGKPEVLTDGGRWAPLRLMQKLEPGARLRCAPGAEAVIVLFRGGKRYRLAAGGDAVVQEDQVNGTRVSPLAGL